MKSRTIYSAAAVVLLSVGLAGCAQDTVVPTSAALAPKVVKDGTLTVCTSLPYEPFEFKRNGKPVGFDIDLANQLAKKLKLESVIINTDFDQIQSGQLLNEGKCDVAIAGLTITGERARVVDFSSPYFNSAQAMVVKSGSGISNLADLAGKKVGVQAGTTGELYLTDNAPASTEIVTFKDATQVDTALSTSAVDAAVYDNTVVGDVVSRYPGFEVAGQFDTGEQYGMAVKKNGSIDLLRSINDMLADLKSDGGYKAIYDRWFGASGTN